MIGWTLPTVKLNSLGLNWEVLITLLVMLVELENSLGNRTVMYWMAFIDVPEVVVVWIWLIVKLRVPWS